MKTKDGIQISLFEYRPEKPTAGALPILLVHGLGASSRAFDLVDQYSFAQFLACQGHITYAINLRGTAPSEVPDWKDRQAWSWNLDTHIQEDIPAAIQWICKRTLSKQLHWIGHSMGGICYFGMVAKNQVQKIASAITIASSLDYSETGSSYEKLLGLKKALSLIPYFPLGLTHKALAPLIGYFKSDFEKFHVYPDNMDRKIFQKLMKNFHTIPSSLLRQLATLFEQGGIRDDRGVQYLSALREAERYPPTLAIAGDMDLQCSPDAVERTVSHFPENKIEFKTFGLGYGHQTHYGHFDLICGIHAPKEVWPVVSNWLAKF